jgi:hypothetical protein
MSVGGAHPWNSVCRRCGSNNEARSAKCWLCGSEDLRPPSGAPTPAAVSGSPSRKADGVWYLADDLTPPHRPPRRTFTKIVTAIGALAVLLYAIGIWSEAPGLSILIIVVELGAVLLVLASRQFDPNDPKAGRSQSNAGSRALGVVASFIVKLAVVIGAIAGLAIVAGVSLVVFLLVICSSMVIGR